MSIATENSKIGVNLYREKFLKGDSSNCLKVTILSILPLSGLLA